MAFPLIPIISLAGTLIKAHKGASMAPFFKPGSGLYKRFYEPSLDPVTTSIQDPMDISGPFVSPGDYFNPTPFTGFTDQGVPQIEAGEGPLDRLGKAAEAAGRALLPQFFQNDQVNTGISVSGSQFPGRCKPTRRKLKIMVGADGQPHVFAVCPPRRMNPLNARALGRAARRLGMFHNIAAHIEKTVQKACRSGIGRRRVSRMPAGCGPKRCR